MYIEKVGKSKLFFILHMIITVVYHQGKQCIIYLQIAKILNIFLPIFKVININKIVPLTPDGCPFHFFLTNTQFAFFTFA
jgi:hypothetical protein